jgi:hypothetical protein
MALYKNVNGVRIQMTQEEEDAFIAEQEAMQAAQQAEQEATQYMRDREAAYIALGWTCPYEIFDDILERGLEDVMSDRAAVKAQYPKPTEE